MPSTRSPLWTASIVAEAMTPFIPGAGPPPTKIARVSPFMIAEMYDAVLFDLFGTLVTDRGEATPGAAAVLDKLPPARWAVVTSCPRGLAGALIARSGLRRPGTIVTSDDVQRGKPAPDGYLL